MYSASAFVRVVLIVFPGRAVWIRHEVDFAFELVVLLGNKLLAEFFVFFPVLTLTTAVSVAVGGTLTGSGCLLDSFPQ